MKHFISLSLYSRELRLTANTIVALMLLMFIGVATTKAQTYFPQCSQSDSTESSTFRKGGLPTTDFTVTQIGGVYKPSLTPDNTFLRVLVVFVRFNDDLETSNIWPDPLTLPGWAQNIVDTSIATIGSTDPENMSAYYKRNSYRRFNLIGDVEYVTLEYPESFYHRYDSDAYVIRGRILREALDEIHLRYQARGIDFTRYDNWRRTSFYNHQFRPNGPNQLSDNLIDMVWLI